MWGLIRCGLPPYATTTDLVRRRFRWVPGPKASLWPSDAGRDGGDRNVEHCAHAVCSYFASARRNSVNACFAGERDLARPVAVAGAQGRQECATGLTVYLAAVPRTATVLGLPAADPASRCPASCAGWSWCAPTSLPRPASD